MARMPGGQSTTVTITGLGGAVSIASPRLLSSGGHRYCSSVAMYNQQNTSVDSIQQTIDRRKTFRTRGSLGPTIASAPSVEQEDYRTPRPSIPSIKFGKSFDLDRQRGPQASDSNGLIKVSADLLRLTGSRQQFKSLLTARKKLGQMPPAFTCVDYDSFESAAGKPPHNGPVTITVEDTTMKPPANNSIVSSDHGSQRSSVDEKNALVVGENGGLINSNRVRSGSIQQQGNLNRNNSRYGVPIDGSAVKMIYKIRSHRLNTRVKIADRCLILALVGILLMVIDAELCAQKTFGITKDHAISLSCRVLIVFSSLALLMEIIHFHVNELLLDLIDCGADDWRVVCTWRKISRFLLEFFVCSICPIPGSGTIYWSFIEAPRFRSRSNLNINIGSMGYVLKPVPVDVVLSLMMIGRIYLFCRFIVLHSKQFQDASTRTLAALNRIQVNFTFVMKTVLDQRPMLFLSIFLLAFWVTSAWSFVQCERPGRDEESQVLYANAFWFIAATFNGNGYGDVVPKTIAGRLIGIFVGIIGAIISSILIAVVSRNILLSQGQKNVNNFMNDSRISQEHKHSAARVIQTMWKTYRCLHSNQVADRLLRKRQRQFLNAIYEFRHVKNKMRLIGESNDNSFQQINRVMHEMNASMQKLMDSQQEMRAQIEVLQRAMRNHFSQSANHTKFEH